MARFPLIHLPFGRNPNFTGREEILAWLEAQLNQADGRAVISQAIRLGRGGGLVMSSGGEGHDCFRGCQRLACESGWVSASWFQLSFLRRANSASTAVSNPT